MRYDASTWVIGLRAIPYGKQGTSASMKCGKAVRGEVLPSATGANKPCAARGSSSMLTATPYGSPIMLADSGSRHPMERSTGKEQMVTGGGATAPHRTSPRV